MSGPAGGPEDVRDALAGLTRRLDELAGALARIGPSPTPAPVVGAPLGEAERRGLADLASLLAVGPDLPRAAALTLVLDRARHGALADAAALFLPGGEGWLEAAAQRGLGDVPFRLTADQGIVGRAFREREVIAGGADAAGADPVMGAHGLGQALALPVRLGDGSPVGVLFAGRRRAVPFDGQALSALALAADRAALALAAPGSPVVAAAEAGALGADLDLERTAARVAGAVAARLAAPRVAVLVPAGAGWCLVGAIGLPRDGGVGLEDVPVLAEVARTGAPWVAARAADPALDALLGAPARLAAPLGAPAGPAVAVVVAGGEGPLAPVPLGDLATHAGSALRNARLYGETAAALAETRAAPGGPPAAPAPVRDLASLLAVCLARIGLARERVRDAGAAADLAMAEEAAWRAAEGIRGVLGFAPGHREAALTPLDLGAAARAAVAAARARWPAERGGPRLALDLEPLPPVRGRPEELAEALAHLLDNAAEAVGAGGEVRVRARWDGGRRVELLVEDSGAGMDDAVCGRALEPFFTTRGPGRLGLGLAVVRAIVARHEGTLELTSAPGRGTTVHVTLPPASETRPAAGPAPARVLVIEDDAAIREALVELLRGRGHTALAAADGPAGLAVVEREAVDVVFTDLAVAQVSGFDVARAVKRLRPGTPVVLVTGWPGRLDPAEVAASGIDRVIEKPVGGTEVLAALDAALAGRRAPAP